MLRIPLARLALPFLFASLSPFAAHTATAAPIPTSRLPSPGSWNAMNRH